MKVRIFCLAAALWPLLFPLEAQPGRSDLALMWYNVENLFHPSDDTLPGDDEFTPHGLRAWTYERYRKKITAVARVIIAAGEGYPPDLVGLGEVEDSVVLEDLVSHPLLEPFRYRWIHASGADHRGMDVACLYRELRFTVDRWRVVPPPDPPPYQEGLALTRSMLHISGTWGRRDTLDLILVHLISRYRGAGATADYRLSQAAHLAGYAGGIARNSPHRLVILAGDFNDSWNAYALAPLREAGPDGDTIRIKRPGGGTQSYKYRGVWSSIDHFMALYNQERWVMECRVFSLPDLLVPDEKYGGVKPFRAYNGFSYQGGYSDHLPLLLFITLPLFPGGSAR